MNWNYGLSLMLRVASFLVTIIAFYHAHTNHFDKATFEIGVACLAAILAM